MQSPDTVLRFLWSVGRQAESEFYLSLFQAEAKERFAAIAIDAPVIVERLDALLLDLKLLRDLGLVPMVVLGILDSTESSKQASSLVEKLLQGGVDAQVLNYSFDALEVEPLAEQVRRLSRRGIFPVISLNLAPWTVGARFDVLRLLLDQLGTRKLIFLQRRGGVVVKGRLLGIVNLTNELEGLRMSDEITKKQKVILLEVRRLIEQLGHRCTVAITSPLNLLRELFTASGAGTLLRCSGIIRQFQSYADIDSKRLVDLLGSAFGRTLNNRLFDRAVSKIYLEKEYRGVATVLQTPLGGYMSKFAVDREAQGEGLGRDLWDALIADWPALFWRSRAENPINRWYNRECDGMVRSNPWQIFWRGLPIGEVPAAVSYAVEQPHDFSITANVDQSSVL